jgi:hypothetical protein
MSNLTHEQARFFRDCGYYKLDKVFSLDQTAELREFVSREKRHADAAAPVGEMATKLYGLYDRDPELMHREGSLSELHRKIYANNCCMGSLIV